MSWYIFDFLISSGKGGSAQSCEEASIWIQNLMEKLGLRIHATKGIWGTGTTKLDHLGHTVNTTEMKFIVTEKKQKKMRGVANKLLDQSRVGNCYVSAQVLASFCGKYVSLTLTVP